MATCTHEFVNRTTVFTNIDPATLQADARSKYTCTACNHVLTDEEMSAP